MPEHSNMRNVKQTVLIFTLHCWDVWDKRSQIIPGSQILILSGKADIAQPGIYGIQMPTWKARLDFENSI